MADRRRLTHNGPRAHKSLLLSISDACIVCGHHGSDATDHVVPVARGGSEDDPGNWAPIHGVRGCPVCGRKCNSEKGTKLLSEMSKDGTSVDWFIGP